MRKQKILLLFALLVLSSSFGCVKISSGGPGGILNVVGQVVFQNLFTQWQSAVLTAMMISAFLAILMYMASTIINSKELLAWSKSEFGQLLATGLIVANVFFFITTVNQLVYDHMGVSMGCAQAADCPIELGKTILKGIYSDVREMNRDILMVNNWFLIISNMSFFVEFVIPPWPTFNFAPFAGLGVISDSLSATFDILIKIMMLVKAQQYVLEMVQVALFPSFLFIGILCRTFFFTRKLGGLMIAMALGLYFVFPLSYVFAKDVAYATCLDAAGNYDYFKPCVGNWLFRVKQADIEAMGEMVFKPGTATGGEIQLQPYQGGFVSSVFDWLNGEKLMDQGGIFDRVGRLLVFTTFIPFISLVVTISFIKVLSPLLGGDVEIAGLTRLI